MPELGFVAKKDPRWLVNRYFPSKIGGNPAWLHLNTIPTTERLLCVKCNQPKAFLLQLYVPFEDEHNFHRMIYVFICRTEKCYQPNDASVVTVFRSQLPRRNEFFPEIPPNEIGEPLPEILIDKISLKKEVSVFPEWEIINDDISDNNDSDTDNGENESSDDIERAKEEVEKYDKLKATNQTGTLQNIKQTELEKYAVSSKLKEDPYFEAFQKECKVHPEQILRYDRNGAPLWITCINNSLEIQLKNLPRCPYCDCKRQFEFQIMPQLLNYLNDYNIDWGILAIYTCSQSCILPDGQGYADEFAVKQDIINNAENP